MLSKEVIISRR